MLTYLYLIIQNDIINRQKILRLSIFYKDLKLFL